MGINSALHIIIFDELDAICRQRGTLSGSTGVHDTVVNQLLAKVDIVFGTIMYMYLKCIFVLNVDLHVEYLL